jgi:hypothetical protein
VAKIDPSEAVRQAKTAVEGLEEPYKMEAFKVVLDKLMSDGVDAAINSSRSKVRTGPRKKFPSATALEKSSATSKLDLTVPELEKLQNFVSRFTIKGSELCSFIIANFLMLELDMKRFSTADIEYCYRRLISLKVDVPDVKDVHLSLLWLTSPSRKKEWLKKVGDEFEISNSGLIAFNKLETSALTEKQK